MRQKTAIAILIFLTSLAAFGQEIPAGVVEAFENGKAKQLNEHLHTNIEIKILGKEHITSKQQALRILEDFFKQYPPVSFTVTHQNNKKESNYGVGFLNTKKGDFKVDFYFLEGRKQTIIYFISIENKEK